jgi:hypothetical protein
MTLQGQACAPSQSGVALVIYYTLKVSLRDPCWLCAGLPTRAACYGLNSCISGWCACWLCGCHSSTSLVTTGSAPVCAFPRALSTSSAFPRSGCYMQNGWLMVRVHNWLVKVRPPGRVSCLLKQPCQECTHGYRGICTSLRVSTRAEHVFCVSTQRLLGGICAAFPRSDRYMQKWLAHGYTPNTC